MFPQKTPRFAKKTSNVSDLFLTLLACFLWPFWRFRPLEFNGDASFLWFFHEAFHRGIKYGSEIVITAGPWSILNYSVFHEETYIIVLSMQTAIAVLLTKALIKIINLTPFETFLRFFLVLGIVIAFSLSPDTRSLVYLALLPILYESLDKNKVSFFFALFVAFAAFVGLSKGSYTVVFLMTGSMLMLLECRAKRSFLYSTVLLVSCLLAGLTANHTPLDLFSYVVSIFAVASSYSQIFSEEGSLTLFLLYLFAVLLIWLTILVTELKKNATLLHRLFIILGYSVILLTLIKTGFIRQDGEHVIRSVLALPIIALMYCIANGLVLNAYGSVQNSPYKIFQNLTKITVILFFIITCVFVYSNSSIFDGKIHRVEEQGRGVYDIMFQEARGIKTRYSSEGYNFLIDGYPKENYTLMVSFITPVLRSGIANFNVVPGVTSYMNSGNFISAKNADYLPESGLTNLIYQGHGSAPLSLPFISLIQSYEYIQQISDDYYLFKKREKRLSANTVCTAKVGIKWGEKFTVPSRDADYTLVKVFYERSYLDRLFRIAFKPIPVFFNKLTLTDGEESWERFPIEDKLAATGFLLSALESEKAKMPLSSAKRLAPSSSIFLSAGRKNSEIQWLWNSGLFVRPAPYVQFCNLNFY